MDSGELLVTVTTTMTIVAVLQIIIYELKVYFITTVSLYLLAPASLKKEIKIDGTKVFHSFYCLAPIFFLN